MKKLNKLIFLFYLLNWFVVLVSGSIARPSYKLKNTKTSLSSLCPAVLCGKASRQDCASRTFQFFCSLMGITSLWAPVLWKHHVLPPTSLSTSFARCMVSVLREHCCAEVVEPCGICSTPVSPALAVSSSIKAGFGFISVVHWEGSVRGLLCAGVSCHRFTDLTQT